MPISYQAQSPVSAWCCRRIRPACTRCGCRSSRCRSAWCSSRARRSRGRRTAWPRRSSQAGIPREAISIYPGGADVGAAVLDSCGRSLIFGGTADRRSLSGQPARAGARPRLLARSCSATTWSIDWEKYLDLMVDSVFSTAAAAASTARASGPPGTRKEIADALAERLGPIDVAAAGRSRTPAWPRSPSRARPRRSRSRSTPTCKEAGVDATSPRSTARGWSRRSAATTCCRRSCTASRPSRRSRRRNTCSRSSRVVECPQDEDARGDRPDAGLHGDHRRREASQRS